MSQSNQRVLVSFIGRGTSPQCQSDVPARGTAQETVKPSGGYRTTRYIFPQEWQESPDVSIFGVALLRYHEECLRAPVDKWLVLGSPQSNWDALLEAVPENLWDTTLEQVYDKVSTAVKAEGAHKPSSASGAGCLTDSLLGEWSRVLSERLQPKSIRCQLIGWCEDPAAQLRMWSLLSREVPENSELILDITHGFRHQPMLLAPMVVLLGMLKNITRVELYYGALDIPATAEGGARVLKLDLFPDLLEYIRSVGILQTSGDYEPLGSALIGGNQALHNQLQQIAFEERINRPIKPNPVQSFLAELQRAIPDDHPLQRELLDHLQKEMHKHLQPSHLKRLLTRAEDAFTHKDYLVTYTLLFEALVILAVRHEHPGRPESSLDYQARMEAFNKVCSREEFKVLDIFRKARNALVHASQPSGEGAQEVQRALQSEEELCNLYTKAREAAYKLLHKLEQSSA